MKLKDKKTGVIYNIVSDTIYQKMKETGKYIDIKESGLANVSKEVKENVGRSKK